MGAAIHDIYSAIAKSMHRASEYGIEWRCNGIYPSYERQRMPDSRVITTPCAAIFVSFESLQCYSECMVKWWKWPLGTFQRLIICIFMAHMSVLGMSQSNFWMIQLCLFCKPVHSSREIASIRILFHVRSMSPRTSKTYSCKLHFDIWPKQKYHSMISVPHVWLVLREVYDASRCLRLLAYHLFKISVKNIVRSLFAIYAVRKTTCIMHAWCIFSQSSIYALFWHVAPLFRPLQTDRPKWHVYVHVCTCTQSVPPTS